MIQRKYVINSISIVIFILLLLVGILISIAKINAANNASDKTNPIYNSKLEHIVIIVEENRSLSSILGNSKAPYINTLTKMGATTSNYRAVTKNPYIALTSGASTSIANNCNPLISKCQTNVANITDEIENSGRNWKMYAESMPSSCTFKDTKKYAVRHNPFMYYPSISTNKTQCSTNIVPFNDFWTDVKSNMLPNYSFVSPDVCNDMHDCSTAIGDKWLAQTVPRILSSSEFINHNSLLVITWDEGNKLDNKVLTIFLGNAAKERYTSSEKYNHYSLLRTVEYVWNLKPLTKNDKTASIMDDMLK